MRIRNQQYENYCYPQTFPIYYHESTVKEIL